MRLELTIRDESDPASSRKQELPLANGVTIGRGPESPVQFDGTRVSRQHLAFAYYGGALLLTDVSSTGTWINEQPMPKSVPVPVTPADEIRIPGYRLYAAVLDSEEFAATVIAKSAPKQPEPPPRRPAGPPWWRLDRRERWALFVVSASMALILYYRWL